MANFGNVKFLYGSNIQSAITKSIEAPGSFYIVAGDANGEGVRTPGVIALNGHAWYEAAGGITSVSAGTKDGNAGFLIVETDGTTSSEKFIPFKGAEGSGVTTSVKVSSGDVIYEADIQLATASSISSGITTLKIDSNNKIDSSIKLEYAANSGVLSIKNADGNSTSVNLPLESFLEDAVYKESKVSALAWLATTSYSGGENESTDVVNAINAMEDTPSLILIMHTMERESLTVHKADKAIIVPIATLLNTYDVASTGKTAVITSSDADSTKTFNVEVNNDNKTIKQYTSAVDNGFSKEGIDANELYVTDAIIENSFKVLGGNVGQLSNNTTIAAGTSVVELLKKILVKEADCTAVKPTCTLDVTTTDTVEVGTVVNQTLTATYSDGKFTGSSADYGTAYELAAGCSEGDKTYKRGTTTLAEASDSYAIPSGDTTWSVTCAYGASTATPKKNNDDDSSQSIAAGTTVVSTKTVTGKYKWYLGCTTATSITEDVVKALAGGATGWCANTGETTLKSTWKSNGKSIVVAVPSGFEFTSMIDATFPSVNYVKGGTDTSTQKGNFALSEISDFGIGGTSTTAYTVYLWTITDGVDMSVKDVKIKKS